MNLEKYSNKTQETLQNAQIKAVGAHHQRLTPEHILQEMLKDPQGSVVNLLISFKISFENLNQNIQKLLDLLLNFHSLL